MDQNQQAQKAMILIPARMKHLKVDPRGYAIPYGVIIDTADTPHFAVNDEVIRCRSIRDDLCAICGKPLLRGRWFIGGSLSAFHPHGVFIDPPMHDECSHYALRVCPYLAAPRYVKEIGLKKVEAHRSAFAGGAVFVDPTMIPGRPRNDVFVAICAPGQVVFKSYKIKPRPPYITVEFWRHGTLIERVTGRAALTNRIGAELKQALAEMPMEEKA